jgi:hypothetical protein
MTMMSMKLMTMMRDKEGERVREVVGTETALAWDFL